MIQVHDLRLCQAVQVEAWADHIAANMRQQDVEEVRASGALDPQDALKFSLMVSTDAYCVLDRDGIPILMFGAAPHPLPGVGVGWLLGTDGILRERHSIARATPEYVQKLQETYWCLWNFIDARNSVSMRWLKWGGFKLLKEHPDHGPEKRKFFTFARSAPCVTP